IQLWVNLPARDKMSTPGYQLLKAESFPDVELGSAQARLIAGALGGAQGPAHTHTAMTIFDLEFSENGKVEFELDQGTTTLLVMLRGDAQVQAGQDLAAGQLVVFDRNTQGAIRLAASEGARALVLNGQPLHEPVVARGPFVMNTKEEIVEAMRDYRQGKMGRLQPQERSG
ncbi:MAG: pirin family protein, partial [Kofleriaceae bacterium]|nr:pirin family protein [Kofleriaceae bacterium]